MANRKIKYKAGDLTIIWQPDLCAHAGECVKRLPQVYDPDGRPWVKPEFATTEELVEQIKCCPSGTLSFEMD